MIRKLLKEYRNSNKTVIMDKEGSTSFHEIALKAAGIQIKLQQCQWKNAAIFLPDGSDFIAALMGIILMGKTSFPLNVHLTKHEIIPLLKESDAEVIITSEKDGKFIEYIKAVLGYDLHIVYVEKCQADEVNTLVYEACTELQVPMVMLTTSGSTGKVKIVPLTEQNIEVCVLGYIDKMCFEDMRQDKIRYLLATPFCSAYGLMILFVCLIRSFPMVLLKEGVILKSFYKTVQDFNITHYEGGATILLMMEQTIGKTIPYDIHLLKYFGFGGSKISGATLRKIINAYPEAQLWQGYGMTEAAPLITKCANISIEKLESVGTAIKGVKLYIEANGTITDIPYTGGEILVKGANVMSGYYRNDKETKSVLKNGYLCTGDLGYLDEEGYLYIYGRKKNVIIVRGFNVYPEEIENCILNSQLVKDCIVYGEMDKWGNETVCVDIIPVQIEDSEEHICNEISSHCKKHLVGFKQPREIRIVDIIRKTLSGKNDRKRNDRAWD